MAAMILFSTIWMACDSASVEEDTDVSTGTLSGVVREAGTEIPLLDVAVALNSVETTTDQDGRFAFREVPLGAQTLRINMTGFDAYTKQTVVVAGDNSHDVLLMRTFALRFDHANILVSEVGDGTLFYENVLRLTELESPWAPNSPVRVFSIGENQRLHAQQDFVEPTTDAKHNHVALSVPDFDASLNLLEEEEIAYGPFSGTTGGFQIRRDGVRQIYFQDPTGNWIEINDAQSDVQTLNYSYDHQGIYVSSLEESGLFYREILRLTEIKSPWDDTALTRFFSTGNGGELHLVPRTDESYYRKKKRQHMTFNVDFFDAFLWFLSTKGVDYGNFAGHIGQIDVRPDGVKQIYIQDPNGNWIEIIDAQY
jgi:catechol 2,3-dioxygenase-like lactoylglutathione lyase family enzyme